MTRNDVLAQAQAAHRGGDAEKAEQLYRALLRENPDDADALRFMGILLLQTGRMDQAEHFTAHAASLPSATHLTHQNHAAALMALNRFADAVTACDKALVLEPDYARALFQRGRARARLGLHQEAIADYEHALVLNLREPQIYYFLGVALAAIGNLHGALTAYDNALALQPNFVEALANRGTTLSNIGRDLEALTDFDRALALNPNVAEIHLNRGTALSNLGLLEQADAAYAAAIALKPDCAPAYLNRCTLYMGLKHYAEALEAARAASAINPDLPHLAGTHMHAALQLCDWRDYDSQLSRILDQIERGAGVAPFDLLWLPTSKEHQQKNAVRHVAAKHPADAPLPSRGQRKPGRLRLGYLSGDFKEHPVSYLLFDTLEHHDKTAFEVFAFSTGEDDNSAARKRIIAAVEHFQDVRTLGDRAIAETIRAHDIDILIDIGGHTGPACARILPYHPAPVQVSWLGFAGTTGVADYLIADGVVVPPEHESFYSENIIRLPDCTLPPSARPLADAPLTREEAGLPENAFVFCCFNNSYKILPDMFALWIRLLAKTENSVLWLRGDTQALEDNLRREASTRGIDPSRIIFAPRVGAKAHFARLALADLFLDTAPYNAHTTASDALWSGVPVLTLMGETFVSRVAASLLTSAGLPELITTTPAAYEALALKLATDKTHYAALRARVANARNSAIFDAARFTKNLENAYREIAV